MGVGNIKPWQKQCPQPLSVRGRELQKAMNSSRTEVNWSNFSRHLGHLGISQVGKGIKIQNICEARSDYLCHGNCLFGAVVSSECDSTTVCSLTHRYSNYLVLRPWSSKAPFFEYFPSYSGTTTLCHPVWFGAIFPWAWNPSVSRVSILSLHS